MKHIVLPTDFSDNARNAIVYAINLFGKENVKYFLLNSYSEPNMGTGAIISMKEFLQEKSEEGLREDLKFINEQFPNAEIDISLKAQYGDLLKGIDRLKETESIDFVVMGTKGQQTAERWIIGSVAKNVIQNSSVPVIVVPDEAKYTHVKNIVYATNLSEDESFLMRRLVRLAEAYDAELNILHVDEDESKREWSVGALKKVVNEIAYHKVSYTELVRNSIEDAIIDYTEDNESDLLAITTHTTTLMKKIFHRSMAKQLLLQTDIPMLVFNRNRYE